MRRGNHHTKESILKNSLSHKGNHYSSRTEFKKGMTPWHKGKHLIHSGSFKKGHKSYPGTEKTRFQKGIIPWCKGKKLSEEHKNKLKLSKLGKHYPKMSLARKGKSAPWQKGEKNNQWKGGITTENKRIRMSIDFRLWRESIFARDNWTCQRCKIKGGTLHPHHVKGFAKYKELRFAIDNGITLCKDCHKEFHKRYGNNTNEMPALWS